MDKKKRDEAEIDLKWLQVELKGLLEYFSMVNSIVDLEELKWLLLKYRKPIEAFYKLIDEEKEND